MTDHAEHDWCSTKNAIEGGFFCVVCQNRMPSDIYSDLSDAEYLIFKYHLNEKPWRSAFIPSAKPQSSDLWHGFKKFFSENDFNNSLAAKESGFVYATLLHFLCLEKLDIIDRAVEKPERLVKAIKALFPEKMASLYLPVEQYCLETIFRLTSEGLIKEKMSLQFLVQHARDNHNKGWVVSKGSSYKDMLVLRSYESCWRIIVPSVGFLDIDFKKEGECIDLCVERLEKLLVSDGEKTMQVVALQPEGGDGVVEVLDHEELL